MTTDPKDAERLAEIRADVHNIASALMPGPRDAIQGIVKFLLSQIDHLTQERNSYKQASLDCHDALGKCAVERDEATRRVAALEAEKNLVTSAERPAIGPEPRCPKHSLHTTTDGAGRYWCSVPSCTWKMAQLPLAAPPAADHTERAREDEHADLAHEIMCEAREACGVYHTTAAGKVRRALAAADHTERAREINRTAIEILDPVSAQLPATIWDALHDGITAALTAAERAGAEKMRALDEAVIEAVRKYKRSQSDFKSFTEQGARDASAELDHALAARDVATDGEGR